MDKRPLSGIRVLDMSRVFSGPWGTQILGDLGAEVIKVEQPGRGDDLRRLGPPFLRDGEGRETQESSYYLSVNRNKKSIAVDVSTAPGQKAIRELSAVSDVFIENFKVRDLARYGLEYESISRVNPRIVYCSITAFGQTGPHRHRIGYDSLMQAMCGVMSNRPPLVETNTSAPFWEGVRKHKLMLQYDLKSERYQFFPRPISLSSNDGALEWRESKGTGVLVAFTLTYFPAPGFEAELPYLEGIVQLDEGPLVFAPIAHARYEALKVGMRMRVCWPQAAEGEHPFHFEVVA